MSSHIRPDAIRKYLCVSKYKEISSNIFDKLYLFQATSGMLQSFASLHEYLEAGTQNTVYKDTLLARAIITWLSNQDVDTRDYGKAGTKSPKELLQSLKDGKMTYATCYAILCR